MRQRGKHKNHRHPQNRLNNIDQKNSFLSYVSPSKGLLANSFKLLTIAASQLGLTNARPEYGTWCYGQGFCPTFSGTKYFLGETGTRENPYSRWCEVGSTTEQIFSLVKQKILNGSCGDVTQIPPCDYAQNINYLGKIQDIIFWRGNQVAQASFENCVINLINEANDQYTGTQNEPLWVLAYVAAGLVGAGILGVTGCVVYPRIMKWYKEKQQEKQIANISQENELGEKSPLFPL